jgi:hypothetical protein
MSMYIPVPVACDGSDVDKKTWKHTPCTSKDEARLELSLTDKGKMRGKLCLPDGWIQEIDGALHDSKPQTEYLCPIHGKEKQPWRY